mmetsp:Transcript_131897/g.410029  ORF Transcript_131897/g.410029 Transcript_131897/m.410029 type:complete len:172 (-) Transcript_131897:6-521(-)
MVLCTPIATALRLAAYCEAAEPWEEVFLGALLVLAVLGCLRRLLRPSGAKAHAARGATGIPPSRPPSRILIVNPKDSGKWIYVSPSSAEGMEQARASQQDMKREQTPELGPYGPQKPAPRPRRRRRDPRAAVVRTLMQIASAQRRVRSAGAAGRRRRQRCLFDDVEAALSS